MRFQCLACGKEHASASQYCEECERFMGRFRALVERADDPLPALRHFCEEEFDWVVFDSPEEYEEDCEDRARDFIQQGVSL
jgi:hypothetical protein